MLKSVAKSMSQINASRVDDDDSDSGYDNSGSSSFDTTKERLQLQLKYAPDAGTEVY